MSWITVRMGLEDNQAKVNWIYLSKFIIGTIWEGQFLYIYQLKIVTDTILIATVLSLSILQSLSLRVPLLFYTIFPFHLHHFHLHPPRANQIVGVGSRPISTFLKSLGSSWKVENYCSGITSLLMQSKN